MLDKFELGEEDLRPEDPRVRLKDAWDDTIASWTRNFDQLMPLITGMNMLSMTERRGDPTFNYAVELEALIQGEIPEFTVLLDGLRRAWDGVNGWHISWRHHTRGPVIGLEVQEEPKIFNEPMTFARPIRGPAQFPLREGWVVGSRVGIDRFLGGVGAWVEVGQDQTDQQGVQYSMDQMHAIVLTHPDHRPQP